VNYRLTAEGVEFIHDFLVRIFLPFDERVTGDEYRDRNLIESAVARPFQTAFEQEIWPSIEQKAAALFHSITCNHCFLNGNKRTAVIALDLFLEANGFTLVMPHKDVYQLARETASPRPSDMSQAAVLSSLSSQISVAIVDIATLSSEKAYFQQLGSLFEFAEGQVNARKRLHEALPQLRKLPSDLKLFIPADQ
jgi:death on curing protein